MRRMATWCPKPKGRPEHIPSLLSQGVMPGTLSHPTVRAAAASAVLNVQLGAASVSVLRAPAVRLVWAILLSPRTQCPTYISTASWRMPTSRAFKTEVTWETHDDITSLCLSPEDWSPEMSMRITCWVTSHSSSPPISTVVCHSSIDVWMETSIWSCVWGWFIIKINHNDNHFSNNNCDQQPFFWSTYFPTSLVYMLL